MNRESIDEIIQRLDAIDGAISQHMAGIGQLKEERARILARLAPLAPYLAAGNADGAADAAPAKRLENFTVFSGVVMDFSEATNLGDRVIIVAKAVRQAMGEPVHTRQVAECLVERGQSQGSVENLRARIINLLRDHPFFWKHRPSVYSYIGEEEEPPEPLGFPEPCR